MQLASEKGLELAQAAVDDLQADALAVHVNPLQEAVQPEGETDWRGVLAAIEAAVKILPVPVIVKEVGAGIQAPLVVRLFDVGVSSVDVAGLGGTNWARIEAARRPDGSVAAFEPFLDWGIPTLECLLQAAQVCPDKSLIASGGVRHGLDAAKALWAGASMVSLAGPIKTIGNSGLRQRRHRQIQMRILTVMRRYLFFLIVFHIIPVSALLL